MYTPTNLKLRSRVALFRFAFAFPFNPLAYEAVASPIEGLQNNPKVPHAYPCKA